MMRLGEHWSYNLRQDPKRMAFVLARYRFARQWVAGSGPVLELGCSEGLGAPVLAGGGSYLGVDIDGEAVASAQLNFRDSRFEFREGDFLGRRYGKHALVASMDVVEHIPRELESSFFRTLTENLLGDGVAAVGTPNITSQAYASAGSRVGHINLFDADRLRRTMEEHFHHVFLFGMNDEAVHTGYAAMSHFLVAIGVEPKSDDTETA